jgi:thiol-disulfide isomerase/thioredoxin
MKKAQCPTRGAAWLRSRLAAVVVAGAVAMAGIAGTVAHAANAANAAHGANIARAATPMPPDTALPDFERSGDYILVLAGKEVPAEIYQSQRVGGMLILSSALPAPMLLMPSANAADTVNLMKINKKADGSIDLLPGAALAPQGGIDFQDDVVHFKVEGKAAELRANPPLVGLHRADEVTAHNPEYVPRAAAYTPSAPAVATLKKETRPVRVRIFFGSWCPHCREMVPHAIKLEQQLKGSNIHFEYYGLPPHFGSEPAAKENSISGVPTAIVYVGPNMVGRITGLSWNSPETLLVTMLAAPPAGAHPTR